MLTSKRHALGWAAFFLFFVGFVLHARQLYLLSAAVAVLWPLSYWLGRRKLVGLEASRIAPASMQAGEMVDVGIVVRNPSSTRRLFVYASDTLPPRAGMQPPLHPLAVLDPGGEERFSYRLHTPLRGVYALGPIRLHASDTLGLTTFTREIDVTDEVIVYPTPLMLPPLWPRVAAGRQPRRAVRAPSEQGSDFFGIREYVPGDDPRRIHWRTSARRDQLMTIQYAHEEALEGIMILDLFARHHEGEGESSTLEQGVKLAITAARQAELRTGWAGLVATGETDFSVVLDSGPGQYGRLQEALARVEPQQADGWPDGVREYLGPNPPRRPVIVISPRGGRGGLEMARMLLAHNQVVSWFALQTRADDKSRFVALLTSIGCQARAVDCTSPLQPQFNAMRVAHG